MNALQHQRLIVKTQKLSEISLGEMISCLNIFGTNPTQKEIDSRITYSVKIFKELQNKEY